ncbi:hypothetical protein [Mycobacterium kubicae]|uniref:hypothetical protein n=1 Tax=Mycobacterium kubicae TaxID=120959 RepID=UPI0010423AD7|nr:hypothetical protein [Mycobacterium kubicae]
MPLPPEEPQRKRPWHWPSVWFRDETFWRQVLASTLAALSAATVIFLAARTAGFLSHVSWSTVIKTVLFGGLWIALLSVLWVPVQFFLDWRHSRYVKALYREHLRREAENQEQLKRETEDQGGNNPE